MRHAKRVGQWTLLLLLSLTACKKEATSPTPTEPDTNHKGMATDVGTPYGTAVTKTIGTSGGTLTSADGRMKLTIPAGALAANQSISIQPITNEAPGSAPKAYRLSPENIQLNKEVSISYTYTDADTKGSVPEALGTAYQGDDGVWKTRTTTLNKSAKTVSANLKWLDDIAFFQTFHLEPASAVVEITKNLELMVVSSLPDLDQLIPIAANDRELGEEKSFTSKYVKNWSLVGEGILGSRLHKALYTAPAAVPTPNQATVTVTLDLQARGQFQLVGTITIIEHEGVLISAGAGPGGGTYKLTGTPMAEYFSNVNRYHITAKMEGGTPERFKTVEIVIPPQTGSAAWSVNNHVGFSYIVREPGMVENTVYSSIYSDRIRWYDSGGNVEVTHFGEPGGMIIGKFNITQSGYADGNRTQTNVNGWFSVRRPL